MQLLMIILTKTEPQFTFQSITQELLEIEK